MVERIFSLARLIVLDGLRRQAMLGLTLFALAGIASGLLFFDFIPRDIGRASNDYLFSIIWITGFIFLLFHAVQVVAWDNEHGVVHSYLARPLSRTEYCLGLFVGLAILLLTMNTLLGLIGWPLLNFIKKSVGSAYFFHFALPYYLLALLGMYLIELTILAVILLISSVMRGSFPVLLLTLCYYFICSGLPVVRGAVSQKTVASSTEFVGDLLKWLTAFFPNFSLLDLKTFAVTRDTIPQWSILVTPFVLSILYIVIVLWLACVIYKRRDLQ